MNWISTKIEQFVAGETSRHSKKIPQELVDNFLTYQQNMLNFPYSIHNDKNSFKKFLDQDPDQGRI